jgi:hypothetical protein
MNDREENIKLKKEICMLKTQISELLRNCKCVKKNRVIDSQPCKKNKLLESNFKDKYESGNYDDFLIKRSRTFNKNCSFAHIRERVELIDKINMNVGEFKQYIKTCNNKCFLIFGGNGSSKQKPYQERDIFIDFHDGNLELIEP